jgi:hypothetical protein
MVVYHRTPRKQPDKCSSAAIRRHDRTAAAALARVFKPTTPGLANIAASRAPWPSLRSFRRGSLPAPTPQSARPSGAARGDAVSFAKFMAAAGGGGGGGGGGLASARSSGSWGGGGGLTARQLAASGAGPLSSRTTASARGGGRWK